MTVAQSFSAQQVANVVSDVFRSNFSRPIDTSYVLSKIETINNYLETETEEDAKSFILGMLSTELQKQALALLK